MQTIQELQTACSHCDLCALHETRTHLVFGAGNPHADLVFIGEGPGEQEDKQGIPFVGRAGKLLDTMLEILYLDRNDIYITNIVKCRPPKNRDPLNIERAACRSWLDQQLQIIQPKIVVCLGRIAATALIREDFKITREHGKWFDIDGAKYMALYHPAALLRDQNKLPETFVDLKELQHAIAELCPNLSHKNPF